MLRTLLTVTAFASTWAAASAAGAATVHVDGSSTDPVEDGTLAHPYHFISAGVTAASPGDTVQVARGIYAEAITVNEAITIEGSDRLDTVIEAAAAWNLDASGVVLRSLLFQGLGTGVGIEASLPFTLEDSQIQDFGTGVRTYGVASNTTIRHNRFLDNSYGVVLTNSGWSNYVLVENNLISGTHSGLGIATLDSRFRAYHNAVVDQWLGIYAIQSAGFDLPISYAINNLVVASSYGIYGHDLGPSQLKVYSNAITAGTPTYGIAAGDEIWTELDDCGYGTMDPWDHGWEPQGACADGGVFWTDPDGSPADIGPYGGSQGGPWWQTTVCRGPHLFCPAEAMDAWLATRPQVRDAMAFYEAGWVDYDDWSYELHAELDDCLTQTWYGFAPELDYPPFNQLEPGPLDNGIGVHALADARALYVSNAAQSMVTELQGLVPWSMDDYGALELELLLDARTYYYEVLQPLGLRVRTGAGFPAPGEETWAFLDSEIGMGGTRVDTIANALEWSRENMLHFAGSLSEAQVYEFYWNYAGPVPALAVMEGTDPVGPHPQGSSPDPLFAHWTAGCHGTNMFLQAILRAANIPVEYVHPGHALPHFPSEGMWLSHGDDPYNVMAKTADFPAELMLIDDATYQAWFVDDPDPSDNVGRRIVELAAIYLPTALQGYRCNDFAAGLSKTNGSVYAYLQHAYSLAELDAMGFWVALDTEIQAAGTCAVPLPLGSG